MKNKQWREKDWMEIAKRSGLALNHLRAVEFLKDAMFYSKGDIITLSKLREYFTESAIRKLMGEGYVEFKDKL